MFKLFDGLAHFTPLLGIEFERGQKFLELSILALILDVDWEFLLLLVFESVREAAGYHRVAFYFVLGFSHHG